VLLWSNLRASYECGLASGGREIGSELTCKLATVDTVPPATKLFTNRLRANSFGGAAPSYDAHRPSYPAELIDGLLGSDVRDVLDVGAGTGIASRQFAERGANVLAVEPDARMAALARAKGIPVELATFEQWAPEGRSFDLVNFAASFHWVDPDVALPKVRTILRPGGRLTLLWNRLSPIKPTRQDLADIYDDYMDDYLNAHTTRAHHDADQLVAVVAAHGYDVEQRLQPRTIHYSCDEWLDYAFTHSNHLILSAAQAAELRARLADRIGAAGVTVGGDALAIVATPR
jgi:SAM-dependent methyltransferase